MTYLTNSRPGRPVIMGQNGAVTSGHPLASQAGLSILQRGGNAFDAAVAVAAALNVVEPFGSGLGGDSFILVYDAHNHEVKTVNSSGPAPLAAVPERFSNGMPGRGPMSVSVPGAFSGWVTLIEQWGLLSLIDVLEPAIRLAEDGFPVTYNLVDQIKEHESLLMEFPGTANIFFPGGRELRPQEILVQTDLARTFKRLSAGGHDEFYQGDLAREICEAVQAEGGLLDNESMANYRAEIAEPLSVDYRGNTVYTPAPNSSGHVLLQELLMFAEFDPAEYEPLSAELAHLMVEIKKLAFTDRERFNADVLHVGPLPEFLLTRRYARERAALIDPSMCKPAEATVSYKGSDDTTYFAVIDRDGNAVSMTTSINSGFGSGFIPGSTGMLLNNRMRYWHLDSGHPNYLVPGKRVRHTVSPVLVLKDGHPFLVIGTPGADGQVQTIFQVLVHLIDYGVNPQLAVELPRWRSSSIGQESNYPHGQVEKLDIEDRYPSEAVQGLIDRGHNVVPTDRRLTFGSCQLIHVGKSGKQLTFGAAADPRRDGYALAW